MSEVHIEAHESPIKTPKQLIAVVLASFLIPITVIVLLTQLVTSGGPGTDSSALSPEAVARRIKPVGEVAVVDANAPKVEKTGKDIVDAVCGNCHGQGLAGAPKIGDKSKWGPLIKEGHDKLTAMAIKGIRAMPPRGGNPDLSDVEIARAVAFMANQAGANFKEPEAKADAKAAPAKK